MPTTISKLTRKYQATIPEAVRRVLALEAGDSIAFDVEGDEVRVRRAQPVDFAFAHALEPALQEWNSAEDEAAMNLLTLELSNTFSDTLVVRPSLSNFSSRRVSTSL